MAVAMVTGGLCGFRRGKSLRGGLPGGIDQPDVALAQGAVAPGEDVGFGGQRLGLRVVALAQAHLAEVVHDHRIARFDALGALQGGSRLLGPPGGEIAGGAFHQGPHHRAFRA